MSKSPSNKKDGSSYLASLNKKELIQKCIELTSQIIEKETQMESLQNEKQDLSKELQSLKKKCDKYFTKDEVIKKILEYKARNLVPILIRDKLILDGIEVDLRVIKNIYNGELSLEYETYYKKCVEDFREKIKIDTKYYKQSSIEELNRILGYAYEILENCEDNLNLQITVLNSISSYIEKRDKLMKNIDETNNDTEEKQILNQTMEEYTDFTKKIYNYAVLGKVSVIGGEDNEGVN